MTYRDRITAAFRGEQPDRVPVSPELWDVIPIRVSGRPFWEFSATSYGRTPLWRAQLEAYRYFDCEAWVPVEPGPSARQQAQVQARSAMEAQADGSQRIRTEVRYRAAGRELQAVKLSCFDYDLWNLQAPVRELERDLPVIEGVFFEDPAELDYSPIREAREATADAGICEGIVGNTFFEFLALHREGGAVQVILDLADHPDYLRSVRDRYAAFLAGVAEAICDRTPVEGLFLNCGSASLNLVSPALFAEWDLPVVRAVAAVARRRGKIMHYHLHGRGRALLEGLVEAGVTMLCPLESPPKGDFVLREVKGRFSGRLALKGGVDPFLLRDGSDAQIEALVRGSLEDASAGGGFTLATGDGVLKDTDFGRIRLLVELARRHGEY
jgi:hypothetical protein